MKCRETREVGQVQRSYGLEVEVAALVPGDPA